MSVIRVKSVVKISTVRYDLRVLSMRITRAMSVISVDCCGCCEYYRCYWCHECYCVVHVMCIMSVISVMSVVGVLSMLCVVFCVSRAMVDVKNVIYCLMLRLFKVL